MSRELPVVNEVLCTSCGDCVAICPADCLESSNHLPWLARPADCTSCSACVVVCPSIAITMQPISEA